MPSIEATCSAFEAAWRAGQRPRIELHLGETAEPSRSALLRGLLAAELAVRLAAKERPTAEEYQERFPGDAELIAHVLREALAAISADAHPTVGKEPIQSDPAANSMNEADALAATGEYLPANLAPPPIAAADGMPLRFGRYEVRSQRGKGGFGIVYAGWDSQLERPVAIKIPHSKRLTSAEALQQFLQEARRAARLKHPGIVTVYDVGVQDELVYIISDLVDGVSLTDWLKQNHPTWQEAARIIAAVADALAHAHEQRVIHRDVKPANILLLRDLTPVLLDFGLALTEEDPVEKERLRVVGTPVYMSPEQARGQAHRVDGRTDIYSLGVVFYEMLCGRPPFHGKSSNELLRQVREDEPQPLRQMVRDLPRAVEEICLKAMAKKIGDRYTTAGDLAEDLRRVLAGGVSRPDPDGSGEPAHAPGKSTTEGRTDRRRDPLAGSKKTRRRCPDCGQANAAEAQFCSGCGAALAGQAPPSKSKRLDPETDKHSGSPLPSAPSTGLTSSESRRAREAERRQVTVLFCDCDLGDSAELQESLDPEEQHELLMAYQKVCEQAVHRFGGTLVPSGSQGLLVCFGFPTAYEDAAQRAVRSGLAIVQGMAGLNETLHKESGSRLSVVIAIHTGMVIVGDMTAGEGGESISLVGEARNVAARLGTVAQPDTVILSEATHRLIRGFFVCESRGTHAVKGSPRPLEVFQALRETEALSRIEVAEPTGLTPLIGRDQEVGLLRDRWEQAREGMGQVVLLIGEAGIGKSRLVHVLKEHAGREHQGPDAPVLEWRCSPYYQSTELYPVIDLFERLLQLRREDSHQARLTKLVSHLKSFHLDGPEWVPLFADLLSIALDERYAPLNLSPQRQKEKTLAALLDWLREYARKQPVLFIVEDLHWVDPSTLEFLALLVEQGFNDRVLTLLTFRPEFETPWRSRAHQTQVALNRLTKRQIADMMRQKTGVKNLPQTVIDQVIARTEGVPLFVEEFTKMVQESGYLRESEDDVLLSASFPLREIPATLQDLLMARLDRMASVRDVAQLGATLGREFTYELIRAVSSLDEDTLRQELAKLVEAELLFQKGRPPQSSYVFKHALIQDAAYQSLLKSKRQQFHKRVAQVLEEKFPETAESQPALLAYHYTEAGLTQQGIDYWLKAGLRSRARSANTEAIDQFRRGLQLVQTLPESPERDRQERAFQVPLGLAILTAKGYAYPQLGPVYERTRVLCEKIGDSTGLFHVMWGNWAWRLVRDELDICLGLKDEVLTLVESLKDPGILMEGYFVPGSTFLYRGVFAEARSHNERGFGYYDPERCRRHALSTGQNCGVAMQCNWALALWHLGYPDQALQRSAATLAAARELNQPFNLAFAWHHAGWLHQHCRLAKETRECGEAAVAIASEQGYTFWEATGTLYRASGLLLEGRAPEALEQIQKGIALYRATGAELALPYYYSFLADAYGKCGQSDDALRTLDEALVVAQRTADRFSEAELYRLKGELLLSRPDADEAEAEAAFQQALAVARAQQAKSWELRATMSLSRLWRKRGRVEEAKQALLAAYGWFTEGFATPDLVDAQALLAEL